jgi:D-glycero-alpha-D-manno-heptose-7-phosphate kinase
MFSEFGDLSPNLQAVILCGRLGTRLRNRVEDFGATLDEAWQVKNQMSPKVSNPDIDQMYNEARRHGAGGGGYLLPDCEHEKKDKVAEAVKELGGIPTEFTCEFHLLQTWRRNGHGNNGNR